jgi:hypothetical protein
MREQRRRTVTQAVLRCATAVLMASAAIVACVAEAAAAETAQLLDGAVSVQLPAGFTRLSPADLASKFARAPRPPIAAFSDAQRGATIAFTWSNQNGGFTSEQLPDYLAAMEQLLPKAVPGLVWQQKEIKPMAGRAWAHLRYASPMVEHDTANDTWFTALRGNILGVNLSAPASRWAQVEPALVSVIEGIRFNDSLPPVSSAASK